MLCPACSTEAPAGSKFCPKCGNPLEAAATPTATQSVAEKVRAAQASSGVATEPEKELWRGSYSPQAMYGSWALAALATLAVVAVFLFVPPPASWMATGIALPIVILFWLLPAIVLLYRRLGVEYTLTTQRFIHKTGVLRRVMNRISIIDIDDVSWEQGLIERMFGVGTIKLLSSDISDPKLILRGIADVSRVANLIDDARREERRKRALYMETV